MKKLILAFIFLQALFFLAGCAKNNSSAKKFTVAVIPKGTTHEFWKSIHAGADKAAKELSAQGTNVEVIWKGPPQRVTAL